MTEIRCPSCGALAPPDATACPDCRRTLRLDVELIRGPTAARDSYALARALAQLVATPSGAEFLAIKSRLEGGVNPLLTGLTADLANAAAELLAQHGAEGRLVQHLVPAATARARMPTRLRPAVVPVALLVAGVALSAWLWPGRRAERRAPDPGAAPSSAGEVGRPLSAREVGSLASSSAATLRCPDSLGTGFFVAADRLVTNAHVLCSGSAPMQVMLSDGRVLAGAVERSDRWLDIAVVRVAGATAPPLALGDASTLRQGDQLFFYGSPRGLDFTLSRAMVSHDRRSINGIAYVQLDGNVNPGNSGGPLLSPSGEVVGIVTAMVGEASGLGLALPVNYLYDGDAPFLPAPPGTDSAAWSKLIGKVSADDEREAEEARASMVLPMLAGVLADGNGGVAALVARESSTEPFGEHFNFRLELRPGEVSCMPSGNAASWSRAGALSGEALDEHTRMWLERHHLETDVWVSAVRLDWSACSAAELSPGSVLVLLGGAPAADRASISTAETRTSAGGPGSR